MDLNRMLDKCRRDQWHVDDLDWSVKPRPMDQAEEMAIVQYFTDMAGIELLAGDLFREQMERTDDPVLKQIFETFVIDEDRHSHVAERLAHHYNVHHYRTYRRNAALERFTPAFRDAVRHLSAELANNYITAGELILDVALLRSINDFVDDDMSRQAMHLINRDESRHIAVDFYMTQLYADLAASGEYAPAKVGPAERMKAYAAFGKVLLHGRPFFDEVFFGPMRLVDPSGVRLREAYKRIQLLQEREDLGARPFLRFMATVRRLYEHPQVGSLFGPALSRLVGIDPSVMGTVYNEQEKTRSLAMNMDELAADALAAKNAN